MPTRETMIDQYYWQDMRLQYDGDPERNPERIERMAKELTDASVGLIETIGDYSKVSTEKVDEDSESRMKYARRALIEAWAKLQASLSATALTFHFPGDEAYERFVQSIADTNKPLDFSDL